MGWTVNNTLGNGWILTHLKLGQGWLSAVSHSQQEIFFRNLEFFFQELEKLVKITLEKHMLPEYLVE